MFKTFVMKAWGGEIIGSIHQLNDPNMILIIFKMYLVSKLVGNDDGPVQPTL